MKQLINRYTKSSGYDSLNKNHFKGFSGIRHFNSMGIIYPSRLAGGRLIVRL